MALIMRPAITLVALLAASMLLHGEQPTGNSAAALQERVAVPKQALAANQSALKQYTWTDVAAKEIQVKVTNSGYAKLQ